MAVITGVTRPRPPGSAGPDRAIVMACAGPADLATVDALARLRLAAKRAGLDLRLVCAGHRLGELLDLAGLDGVVLTGGSDVEVVGEPEPGEEPGVEEVVDVSDPPG